MGCWHRIFSRDWCGLPLRHDRSAFIIPLSYYFFSQSQYFFIKDIANSYLSSLSFTHSRDSSKPDIPKSLIPVWKLYITNLKLSWIVLSIKEDKFIWFGGSQQGKVIVHEAHQIITQPTRQFLFFTWLARSQKWNFPLKLKFFSLLVVQNQILTQEILTKRGYQGPGRCSLCLSVGEDINHLFLHCPFASSVWICVLQLINSLAYFNRSDIVSCLDMWTVHHQIIEHWISLSSGEFSSLEMLSYLRK